MFRRAILASVMAMGLSGPSGAIAHEETIFDSFFGAEPYRDTRTEQALRHEEHQAHRLREAAREHPRMPYSDLHLYD